MRERLRVFIAACLYYSGFIGLVLWLRQRTQRQLIILNYHRAEGNLQAHMKYLRRHYRVMHLEEALEELYAPDADSGKGRGRYDRRTPLVLTFDDGYLDNYTRALPLARKLRMPITIFVIPGYIESGQYFWWMAGKRLLKQLGNRSVTFEGITYTLSSPDQRIAFLGMVDKRVRYASAVAEREAFLAKLQQELGVSLPTREKPDDDADALPITWEQMREMEETGWVSFGAHTVNHPVLSALLDKEEVQREVGESRLILEEKLGHPVRTFAYPIGKPEHFGEQGLQAVKLANYTWAVTTLEEAATQESDPHLLGRLPGDVELHWLVLAAELAGLLGIVSRCRKMYEKFSKKRS